MSARKPYAFLCGVPKTSCTGSVLKLNHALEGPGGTRGHGSSDAAFDCHRAYLLSLGYTQLSARTFLPPDDGPIRVLTRRSKFGARLRNGKEGTRNMAAGNRSGTIVSC